MIKWCFRSFLKAFSVSLFLMALGMSSQSSICLIWIDFFANSEHNSIGMKSIEFGLRCRRLEEGTGLSKWWAIVERGNRLFFSLKINLAVSRVKVCLRSKMLRCSKIGLALTLPRGGKWHNSNYSIYHCLKGFQRFIRGIPPACQTISNIYEFTKA